MTKEEFIGKLQMCYFGERNAFEEIVSNYEELIKENQKLKEENFNLREYIDIDKMSVPYKGDSFEELMNMPTYKELQKENEMLHHYKLLYQKVKERNDKAIEFMKSNLKYAINPDGVDEPYLDCYECRDLLEILKGNSNE